MKLFSFSRLLPLALFASVLAHSPLAFGATPDAGGANVKLTLSQDSIPALASTELSDDGSKPLRATFVVTNANRDPLRLLENAGNNGLLRVFFHLLDIRGETVWQSLPGGQVPRNNTTVLAPGKSWRVTVDIGRIGLGRVIAPGYYTVVAEVFGDARFSAQSQVVFTVPKSLPIAPLAPAVFAGLPSIQSAGDYDERLKISADVNVYPGQEGTVKIGPIKARRQTAADDSLELAVVAREVHFDGIVPNPTIERVSIDVPRQAGIRTVSLNGQSVTVPPYLRLTFEVTDVTIAPSQTTPGSISVSVSGHDTNSIMEGTLRLSEKPPADGIYDCLFFEPVPNPIQVFRIVPSHLTATLEFPTPAGFRGVRVTTSGNTLTKLFP
jgi:hypothetical protein